jgi:hypothetical protein
MRVARLALSSTCLALALATAPASAQEATLLNTHIGDDGVRLGWALDRTGDVDGDGIADYVAGEPREDTVANSAGRARVFSGSDFSVVHSVFGDSQSDQLGYAVCGAGELTADGNAEFAAGAPFDDDNGSASGLVRVYRGDNGNVLHEWRGDAMQDEFGRSVASAGDVDDDGVPDVIVGAPQTNNGGVGYARIFSGATGLELHTLTGVDAQSSYGISVDGAGDVDKDGHDDVIVGAYQDETPGISRGRAYVHSGDDGSVIWTFDGLADFDWFGWSVAGAGDVNGDTWPDLIVGAYGADPGGDASGQVRVFSGQDGSTLLTIDGLADNENLGWSVDGPGDLDGDGKADVMAGAPVEGAGRARTYSGADGSMLLELVGDSSGDQRGRAVAGIGADLNADGHPDVLVGAPLDDDNGSSSGTLQVVSGFQPWRDLGLGMAGAPGVPLLEGSGPLTNSSAGTLDLSGALPNTTSWLVLGFTNLSAPFKGGFLVPNPDIVASGIPVGATGSVSSPFVWPAGVPSGFETFIQWWVDDAAGPKGFSATNGLEATAP